MFTFPLEPNDLFEERARQMRAWGIPAPVVRSVRSRIRDAWSNGPGGWTHEWALEAQRAEQQRRWLVAAACYGAAKFPCVCTEERERAFEKQRECYLRAAPSFPCFFERRDIEIDYRGSKSLTPTHLFAPSRPGPGQRFPILVLSGGVDTFKMELHRLAVALTRLASIAVAAIDMPGTGESELPLAPDSDAVYRGVLEALGSELSPGLSRGVFGVSFGGHFAAKLALSRAVDVAVDLGGPVGATPLDGAFLARLPNGMTGIVSNALGLERLPTPEEAETLVSDFSLRAQGLLAAPSAPLLAVNGSRDPYLAASETTVFASLSEAEVWLVQDGDHCAANRMLRVLPAIAAWLRERLRGSTPLNRLWSRATRACLPALE